MRKPIVLLGIGLLSLSGLLFYAEHKDGLSRSAEGVDAIEQVLKGQNQAFAGRIVESLDRADRDALLALQRWKKKAKIQSFLSDTALTEPDAPKWIVVAGRRIRAAGVSDDALLEDALERHAGAARRLSLYHSRGKYFLFVSGKVDGQDYGAAYAPDAFFSSFRSEDGIKVWLALDDGTVLYHPLHRFIGSNASNLKPVAAGLKELASGGAASFTRGYLGLEGKDTFGAWTPLPAYGLLVGSEWPRDPGASAPSSIFFWMALTTFFAGAALLGWSWRPARAREAEERLFDETRLDDDAMEYLEEARASAAQAIQIAKDRDLALMDTRREREEILARRGALEWKIGALEEFQERILPQFTGKQVWSEVAELVARRSPGLSLVFYRYSPSSFSLVPESAHGVDGLPESALAYLRDARIFIGNPSYLNQLLTTEAFQRWNSKRDRYMPLHQTEFRVYPIQCAGVKGAVLAHFDRRMNSEGELEAALELLGSLLARTATFCDSLSHLLQSLYAKGSAWQTVASASNDAGNRPRSS